MRNYGICSNHFSDTSFLNADKIKLKWNAVPIPYSRIQQRENLTPTTSQIQTATNFNSTPCPRTSQLNDLECKNSNDDISAVTRLPSISVLLNTLTHCEVEKADSVAIEGSDENRSDKILRVYHHNRLTFDDNYSDDMDWIKFDPQPVCISKMSNIDNIRKPIAAARKKSISIEKKRFRSIY
ncbi:unnamed protein product [Lasius platythorax]|uniref:THAP-type domain-containing protein n=1 Tax=Lasius platythorax TaxID=488582 RepID=A0AAV2MY60_9HYME